MKNLIFITSLFWFSTTVLAEDRVFLTKAEVEPLAAGKKWVQIRSADKNQVEWEIRAGGQLYANNRTSSGRDSGQWLINDSGQLCVKWRGRSEDRCVALLHSGENYQMVDSKDMNGVYADVLIN